MAYIGLPPSNSFVSLKRQVITGDGTASYTLDHSVASVNDVAIFVNNVRQDPAGYSISGTTLTLGGTIQSSDDCYVIFLGQALQTVVPDTGTITSAMLNLTSNVGIGETSPLSLFHVKSADSGADVFTDTVATLENSGDTRLSILSGTSGEGEILFGDSGLNRQGRIAYRHNGDKLVFQTGNTERMTLNSTGLGVGASSPTHKLQVTGEFTGTSTGAALFQNTHDSVTSGDEVVRIQFSGDNDATGGHFINFFDSGGDIGRINVNSASNIQYATTSDYRLKENIKDIENAIDKLKLLKPRNFNFIKKPDVSMDGFIAHELQDVVPIAVDGVKDQMRVVDGKEEIYPQAVDASKLIPILTKSLQEAITKIEELETRIQTLENN
jgi:hypothetical protein